MTRLGSVACVASSRATAGKVVSIKRGSAAAVVVQHTTSAQLKTSLIAHISRLLISRRRSVWNALAFSYASPPTRSMILTLSKAPGTSSRKLAASRPSGVSAAITSSVNLRTPAPTLASGPRRTTRTPALPRPSARPSAAALVSPQARMGRTTPRWTPTSRDASAMMASNAVRVRVLPVPGGPCHRVNVVDREAATADRWELFKPASAASRRAAAAFHASKAPHGGGVAADSAVLGSPSTTDRTLSSPRFHSEAGVASPSSSGVESPLRLRRLGPSFLILTMSDHDMLSRFRASSWRLVVTSGESSSRRQSMRGSSSIIGASAEGTLTSTENCEISTMVALSPEGGGRWEPSFTSSRKSGFRPPLAAWLAAKLAAKSFTGLPTARLCDGRGRRSGAGASAAGAPAAAWPSMAVASRTASMLRLSAWVPVVAAAAVAASPSLAPA